MTRLVDPDAILKTKIAEFVNRGEFGLASGNNNDGSYGRTWFEEPLATDEIAFEADVFLLRKATAQVLRAGKPVTPRPSPEPIPEPPPVAEPQPGPIAGSTPEPTAATRTLRLAGSVPPEIWNRLGTKILPKLRSGSNLKIGVEFTVTAPADAATGLTAELRQILQELGLGDVVQIE